MYTYAHTLITWRQRNNSQTRTHIPARKENKLQRNVHTHIYLCIHGYTPRVKKPTIAALAREFHNDTRHNIIPAFFSTFPTEVASRYLHPASKSSRITS